MPSPLAILFLLLASHLIPPSQAWTPPSYLPTYQTLFSEPFTGPSGILPSTNTWTILSADLNVNHELETYRADPRYVQLSGGNTLQLVPWRDSSSRGGWSSGRIESKYTFIPRAGAKTMVEASIRFGVGEVGTKKGIWPAFWMLGDAVRDGSGTGWPACGEVDAMETVNGVLTGYGTAHCGVFPGGVCNEPSGLAGSVTIPDQGWYRWRVVWDRTPAQWQDESIAWYLNDQLYHQLFGSQIGDLNTWASLAQRPLFFILNVAVGGDWPGYPDGNTVDGYASMMEVGYIAHYVSV
ncbi:glucan endo-1,3-beta-glucosidase [Echria macrotheca]|uniref:Glucan endo-1,3-beta-glucosidase n=1 Tax=Echria macrotheca TaxID=438768 RepID=A0AAJ0B7K7_9PEZI|nr:glucan endo-1,3-beta-glucosidase [Echria macrotheca]